VGQNNITVIVAHDREGGPTTESMLNISILKKEFCSGKSRIADIWEVIATQDIESWLFQDINGLYDFLKVPKKKRNYDKFKDTESLNNVTLSTLFREQGKLYMKGKKFAGLIAKLDIKKIIANTPELRELLELIKSLCL
jgi:hypothetical protein